MSINPTLRTALRAAILPLRDWLASSQCVTVLCYREPGNSTFLCSGCYHCRESQHQSQFNRVWRHYVYIGILENLPEECRECRTTIGLPRPYRQCPSCTDAINNFVLYLLESGDTPYDDEGPTFLMISQNIESYESFSSTNEL